LRIDKFHIGRTTTARPPTDEVCSIIYTIGYILQYVLQ
jgi:hypothetical protein